MKLMIVMAKLLINEDGVDIDDLKGGKDNF